MTRSASKGGGKEDVVFRGVEGISSRSRLNRSIECNTFGGTTILISFWYLNLSLQFSLL